MADSFTLDPQNWDEVRAIGHHMLDDMFDYIEHIRSRPVWQAMPPSVRSRFLTPLPEQGEDIAAVYREFSQYILPYALGNVHPGFLGWVHGGGTPVGMLAEMLAAGLNSNLGGRDHSALEIERQMVEWVRQIFGFPETASGLFLTGTSMANLAGLLVARTVALGPESRENGVFETGRILRAYTSRGAHMCIRKAMEMSGLGANALRLIDTDGKHRMNIARLEESVQQDRRSGLRPFLVIATAGTVDVGAIDDLDAIHQFCCAEKLWLHVDGAFGALAKLSPELSPQLSGIEKADSIAFDFHKWAQVPYDAGFLLVRDATAQLETFASPATYLRRDATGLAAGSPWPCDLGPDLSRGFRALKAWFTLKTFGTAQIGAVIAQCCGLARYLEARVLAEPKLELLAPVQLNIVCFRHRSKNPDVFNRQLAIAIQESGLAAPSTTTINGQLAIRAAIVNHRTQRSDIDTLIDATLSLGATIRDA